LFCDDSSNSKFLHQLVDSRRAKQPKDDSGPHHKISISENPNAVISVVLLLLLLLQLF